MNANIVMYLAAIAAVIHVLLGALQSNTLNSVLANFGIPAVPTSAMPWIGLVLGLGGGFVTGLQQGEPWQQALVTAIMGMLSGGASALHVESMVGNTHAAVKAASGGGGGGNVAVNAATTIPPAAPPPPPSHARRRLIPAMGLTLVVSVIGCSWFQANKPQVTSDVGQIASCVLTQLFQGNSDPLKITGACIGATMADIEQILASVINFYEQPAEAGIAASDKHCGSGKAPFDNMPACVTADQLVSFKKAHDQAKGAR